MSLSRWACDTCGRHWWAPGPRAECPWGTLTAAEMRALGFVRQPSLPKIKFVQWEAA